MKKEHKSFLVNLKEFEKNKPSIREFVAKEYLDKNENAVIKIFSSKSELTNKFGGEFVKAINSEIYDYIDAEVYPIPTLIPIILEFHVDGLTESEKMKIKEEVSSHYTLILQDKSLDKKINGWTSIGLALLGAILLSISYYFNTIEIGAFVREFMSIAATFALWEAVDYYMIERKQIKIDHLNAGQMALAKIVFID